MPYQAGSRLPGEKASKLGHLAIVNSPFIKSLVDQFEFPEETHEDPCETHWTEFNRQCAIPLSVIAAVDGSLQTVSSQDKAPVRELSFVKTALIRMDKQKIEAIDPKYPHPVQLRTLMSESALFHSTLFPLKNIRIGNQSNYEVIRQIIRESMQQDLDGAVYQTLKWLAYHKWSRDKRNSPSFNCPHCDKETHGLPFDADEGLCEHCGKVILLTDMIGFHLEMNEDSASEGIASSYMTVHETLLLFTFIKYFWDKGWQKDLTNVLLIKDGPLTLRSQYSKLVPSIREFFDFANKSGYPICLIGQVAVAWAPNISSIPSPRRTSLNASPSGTARGPAHVPPLR